jgi:hypothetical protein
MKIMFLCGSLEPGRDGVGDYTRRLADECARRGHACAVIALHDPHVRRETAGFAGAVRFLRLPASAAWAGRVGRVLQEQRDCAPDWVSWQLVAYGLDPRGLVPSALLDRAPELRGPRCHVMMHELWIGLEAGSGWRARATGWRQRRGVLRLLERLRPDSLQTSNPAYRQALGHAGLAAGVLGLFGNVPVADDATGGADALARWLPAAGGAAPLVGIAFGTLHPQWRPGATVDWLKVTARRHGRPPALLAVGRLGPHAAATLEAFARQQVRVAVTGEQDAARVSELLRSADFGIAPHPWALIGKSGAAAAMLEHGLPVLVPRDDWRLRVASSVPATAPDALLARLAELDPGRTDRWLAARRTPESALPRIADALLEVLGRASPRLAVPSR